MDGWFFRATLPAYRFCQRTKNAVSRKIDPPLLILLYHRVTTLSADHEKLAVTPDRFREQMQYLKVNCQPVKLTDGWSDLSKPAVAITFDDGYADNALEALPILEELEVPATFFVSTGNIDTDCEFWWDYLARILLVGLPNPDSFTLNDRYHGQTWATSTFHQRQQLYHELSHLAQQTSPEVLNGWLEQLAEWSGYPGTPDKTNRSMTWAELRQLAGSRWATIGAHAVSHTALSALDPNRQRQEIFQSKLTLEEQLGQSIHLFSYPYGNRKHYNRTTIHLCREAGFTRGIANFPGRVHRWTDPYQLPRQVVRNWDLATFADCLKNWI